MEIPGCSFICNTLWLVFFYILFSIVRGLYLYCFRKGKDLRTMYTEEGKDTYACVTGATSGIGKGFAFDLAARGFNILLISRSESKLKKVQEELKSRYNSLKIDYVVADFGSNQSIEFYEKVSSEINKYDIGLLVNNAGIMYIGMFNEISAQQDLHTMDVNMLPYALLTRYILPVMMERKARGGIIITSSVGIEMSCSPVNAIYMATKAFNDSFARGLAYEVEKKIDVLSLKPAFVATNMTKKEKGLDTIGPLDCASSALNQLGFMKSASCNWSHEAQSFLLNAVDKLFPSSFHHSFFTKLEGDLAAHLKNVA